MTRLLVVLTCVSCGGGSSTVAPDAPALLGMHLGPNCAQPLADDGGIAFPDTVASVQHATRTLELFGDSAELVTAWGATWEVEGPDGGDFAFEKTSPQDPQNCFSYFGMGHGGSASSTSPCRFTIDFTPTTVGEKQAVLHFRSEPNYGGPLAEARFTIHAAAIAPSGGLTTTIPDAYVLGSGPSSAGASLRITNSGPAAIDLGDPVVDAPFTATWNCPASLTPGGACDANIAVTSYAGCHTSALTSTTSALHVPVAALAAAMNVYLSVQGEGAVVVTSGASSQTCRNDDCISLMLSGDEPVTLEAVPDSGAHFRSWSAISSATCAGTSCSIPAGASSAQVGAAFTTASSKAIAVTIVGTGTVASAIGSCTASCTLFPDAGEQVTLMASTSGTFGGWSGDCTGTDPACNLGTVINDRSVTATFAP